MDIKSVATTAKIVIESLVVLLDGEGVDVESIKMNIGGGNQELDFKKLIDLALSELKLIQDSGAQAPEGFVLVPMVPSERMVDAVRKCYEGEAYLPYSLYSEFINQAMIEAQEQSNA